MTFEHPAFKKDGFNCPHCNAYAHQEFYPSAFARYRTYEEVDNLNIAFCKRCKNYSLWIDGNIIYPDILVVPLPNEDLNSNIKRDYLEAAIIVNKSPRGSAALLRLAIQKLCIQLGESGDKLNDDIASLVGKGLHPKIQKALDAVRVIGNEAIHPGQMDLRDNTDTSLKLFDLVNIIAEDMITKHKKIDEIYNSLPKEKLTAIEKRDAKVG